MPEPARRREPAWCCERCDLTLPTLHDRDGVSYSAAVRAWICVACTLATKQHVLIRRPWGDGEGPERRRGSRVL